MSGRIFVAMSGGVDSSLTAALLKERGEDVVGVWMRLVPKGTDANAPRCCGTDEAGEDARRAAAHVGIPFYALDYADVFGRQVVDRFVDAYASGETPNPCVSCNAHVKFEALLRDVVAKFGGARLATGHYARVTTGADGRRHLRRARDSAKDQSYALYMLGQRELRRIELPIGELRDKAETRELATRFGLPNAAKAESMDICFVPGDYRDLVRDRAPNAFVPGPVERLDGAAVGVHAGVGALTVGQRSGVGVATGERLYVLRLEPERNAAVVGTREEIVMTTYALGEVRFVADAPPATEFATTVVLRYRGTPLAARVVVHGDEAILTLDRPALVAPGQAAVFYEGDDVIGGGTVRRIAGGTAPRD
ncbi:MAG: tRNA 2-thiouridine(34) synthase MnmA [Chloroflexi bacterium]|nr:MAG: tRNA 2-thiouridine(34) synthase MnmA [Chloroflexota bacterium]TMG40820.1 MAG: tRNA 2-thiouridine(34) synthase MnmA [Chloroflexota bacterium]